jgi:hypothetical protein
MSTETTQRNDETIPPQGPLPVQFTGKRLWRNYLIDPIQVRYTAVIVLVSACLTGGLGYFVIRNAHDASETVKLTLLEKATDPGESEIIMRQFEAGDRKMLILLAAFGLLLCVVLTLYGIIITHKVAGPLFKISGYLQNMRDGRLGTVQKLRKGDQLHDFYETFRGMHKAVRWRTEQEIDLLARAIAALEGCAATDPGAAAQLEQLRLLRRQKQESLT